LEVLAWIWLFQANYNRWIRTLLNSKKYDFLIAGAGIIGLSVAKELTERYPSAKIAILEKEQRIGMHASGRNSGVLHSGIYYPQDSLKSQVCAVGAKRMFHFAQEHKIPCKKMGKIIIATSEQEVPIIDFLLKNAANNNIQAQRLNEKEIKEIEPHASPFQCGIFAPDTASIDSKKVLETLREIITSRGVDLYFGQEVLAISTKNNLVKATSEKFHYGYFYNCAGAGTDKIAKMFGLAKDYALLPFKGIYYKLSKERSHLVNGNVYPVPDLKLPFLGVHFTKTINGDIYVGPTAIPAFGRENYGVVQGVSTEAFRILKDITLMYIANQQNFRLLMHSEMKKYLKPYFIRAARKLISSIDTKDLQASNKVGIRPQLINLAKRKIEMDYIVEQDANSLHVLNAISPAFTGSFRFAELLVDRMQHNKQELLAVN